MYTKKYFKHEFNFEFSTKEEYIKSISFINDHFNQAMTLSGTYQYHTFIHFDESASKIYVKYFLQDIKSSQEIATRSPQKLQLKDVHGYVTIMYKQNCG